MFKDRADAGKQLAQVLEKYTGQKCIVLAIPKGGVEVGYYVADYLDADFSIIISRKLPFPDNPESGFGAIAEDGSEFIFNGADRWFTQNTLEKIKEEQTDEIYRRIYALRDGKPLPEIEDRTVILVDDGIAMGSTMRAAVKCCRNKKAKKIVVAAPVSSNETYDQFQKLVDEVYILEKPPFFRAVAQVYHNWYDMSDHEVIEIMKKWHERVVPTTT